MGRVSSRRIIWMVLVAVLASGAGVALSLREAPPPVPNLGTRSDREEIMRLALSTLRPFGDLYIPSLPLPADEHGDREAEPMRPSGPAHGDSAGMGEHARKGIVREFRLADATLAVCSQDVSQPHCMQDISLAEQLDISVPRELWSQWLQVNATQSQVPGSVGQGVKRIAAEDVPGYFALPVDASLTKYGRDSTSYGSGSLFSAWTAMTL